jgi:replication-associated recombination protein RarA
MYQLRTNRGYVLLEVASALQKAIRRGDAELAGYWTIELWESNYKEYIWRRLLTVSAEDCFGIITKEIKALYDSWKIIDGHKKGTGRIFVSKAVILLCMAKKSRDADHLTNLVYDSSSIDVKKLDKGLEEARKHPEPIPDYAFDVHTQKGRKAGKTKKDFFKQEHAALTPRIPGLFVDRVLIL